MHTDKKGFTLIEVVVAVALFAIIVTVATSSFVHALRTQGQITSIISAESNVSLILEQMAREMRTGYLFCDMSGGTQPIPGCDAPPAKIPLPPGVARTTCTVSDSYYHADPGVLKNPNGQSYLYPGTSDLALWTCPSIDYFTNIGGITQHDAYYLLNGVLMKTNPDAANPAAVAQPLTSSDVRVKNLQFIIFGATEGDRWNPRITVSLGIAPSSTDAAVEGDTTYLETTVSARQVDCTQGSPSSC